MSSVDKLDLVQEVSLQRRESFLSGVGFFCMNALPHPPKCTWFSAPPLQRCPHFADETLDRRHRVIMLGRCCRRRTRKDASIAHCKEGTALGGVCEVGRGIFASAASHCGNTEVVHDAEGRLRDNLGQVAGHAVEARGEAIESKKHLYFGFGRW